MSITSGHAVLSTVSNIESINFGNGHSLFVLHTVTTAGSSSNLPNGSVYIDAHANAGLIVGSVFRPFRKTGSSSSPITSPSQPRSVVAVSLANGTGAQITFQAPLSNGGASITQYTVTAYEVVGSVVSGTASQSIVLTNLSSLSVDLNGLTRGSTYVFKVVAKNTSNLSSDAAASGQITLNNVTTVPLNVVATAQSNGTSALVTFTAPVSTNGSDITSYTVHAYLNGAGSSVASVSSSVLSATVTGLTMGAAYTFKVLATNAAGDSNLSDASLSVTMLNKPGKPTTVSSTSAAVVTFVAPTNDGGLEITSYTVNAYLVNATTVVVATATLDMTTDPTPDLSVTVTGLTEGQQYVFKVLAHNSLGDSELSNPSASITYTTSSPPPSSATVPGKPTIVSAVGASSGTSANVTFTSPVSDGGAMITKYIAYGYPVTNGTPQETPTAGAELIMSIVTTPDVQIVISVPRLISSQTYIFRVVAYNSEGNGELSDPSSQVTIPTPVLVPAAPIIVGTYPQLSGTSIALTFTTGTPTLGAPPTTSYSIYAYLNGEGEPVATGSTMMGMPTGIVNGLTLRSSYRLLMTATNSDGEGAPSKFSELTVAGQLINLDAYYPIIGGWRVLDGPLQGGTEWVDRSGSSKATYHSLNGGGRKTTYENASNPHGAIPVYEGDSGSWWQMYGPNDFTAAYSNPSTITMWVALDNFDSGGKLVPLLYKFNGDMPATPFYCSGFMIGSAPTTNNGFWRPTVHLRTMGSNVSASENEIHVDAAASVSTTGFHQVTVVFTGGGTANGSVSIYVDGGNKAALSGLDFRNFNDAITNNVATLGNGITTSSASEMLSPSMGVAYNPKPTFSTVSWYGFGFTDAEVGTYYNNTRSWFYPVDVPNAPTNVKFPGNMVMTSGMGMSAVVFDAPVNQGASAITEYKVYSYRYSSTRSWVSGPIVTISSTSNPNPSLIPTMITGLVADAYYKFVVTAVNGAGESPRSEESNPVRV